MDAFVVVASYLPRFAGHALAGRLQSEGIDARVKPQGDSLEPYRGPAAHGFVQIIVPESSAGRARWLVEQLHPEPEEDPPADAEAWHPEERQGGP